MRTCGSFKKKPIDSLHSIVSFFFEGLNQLQTKDISTFGKYHTIYTHKSLYTYHIYIYKNAININR